MAYSAPNPQTLPGAVHAVLAANRLEARPRSPEFNRALRAEIRDATWLLARQWQLREFEAEDRGTPAFAQVALRALPLSQLALGGGAPRPYTPAHQPLEAAVEAQPRPIGAGLRLQLGQLWRRLLRSLPGLALTTQAAEHDARAAALARWPAAFPLHAQVASAPLAFAQESTTPEVQALLALAEPGAPLLDGYALYEALLQNFNADLTAEHLADSTLLETALGQLPLAQRLLAQAPLADGSPATARLLALGADLDACARQYVLACHRLYLLGHDSPAWRTEDMAYDFTVGAAGPVALGTAHYPGGAALPWYAVDAQPALPAQPAAASVALTTGRRLATEVQFPGAPAARWWEFEDRRVDVGQLTADPADWGRMLLQEFMLLYQNDWFSVPYTVPTGAVCTIEHVRVTDVFGRTYTIQPAGAGTLTEDDAAQTRIDYDAGRWRLFAQTDAAQPAAAPQLYVPAAALSPLVGPPVEQVSFRREEATNLVWAVESIVPDGFAGGLDGSAAAAQFAQALAALAPAPVAADPAGLAGPAYTYQLASTVPENWLPFVAVPRDPTTTGSPHVLEQGVLLRQVPGFTSTEVAPRTSLLQLHAGQPYCLHEHEVPPAGLRVEGASYRVRWHDGRTLHWFGRRRGVAPAGGSSGLAFDQLS